NGGITLPDGFCAVVLADQVGRARHLAVAPNGDVFVALEDGRGAAARGGVLALRDTSGDGKADRIEHFGTAGGTGIVLGKGVLFFGTGTAVLRYALPAGQLTAAGEPQVVVHDLPAGGHGAKNLALSTDGSTLFVNIGSPSNSCQLADRALESPGKDPCPELATRAGVWRFDARGTNQAQPDGKRYATGIRNAVGLALDPAGQPWATQHGRDQLGQHWPGLLFYTGSQFPASYRGGAFIAFHGSWNRAPLPQAGYRVVFVPFKDGKPAGTYQTFADGFWHENGTGPQHRPVGLALGPDGSLYVTDDAAGRIWRVIYRGR